MYKLVTYTQDGSKHEHFFDDYEDLDYNATFCQFSPNIVKALGQKRGVFKWETLFTIGG